MEASTSPHPSARRLSRVPLSERRATVSTPALEPWLRDPRVGELPFFTAECGKVQASLKIGAAHGEGLWEETGGLPGQLGKARVQRAFLSSGEGALEQRAWARTHLRTWELRIPSRGRISLVQSVEPVVPRDRSADN